MVHTRTSSVTVRLMDRELERFAELLVTRVRDASVRSVDRMATVSGPLGDRWREAAQLGTPEALHELIPDIVDEVVFKLLDAFDNDLVPLAWLTDNGDAVGLSELGLGEMGGSYAGGEWRRRYSSERWADLFSELELRDE